MDTKNRWHSFRSWYVECCESKASKVNIRNRILWILIYLNWFGIFGNVCFILVYLVLNEIHVAYLSLQTWVEPDDKLTTPATCFLGIIRYESGRVCVPTDSCAWRIGTVWAYFHNSHPMGWRIEGHCWMMNAGKGRRSIWASNKTPLALAQLLLLALLCVSIDVRYL